MIKKYILYCLCLFSLSACKGKKDPVVQTSPTSTTDQTVPVIEKKSEAQIRLDSTKRETDHPLECLRVSAQFERVDEVVNASINLYNSAHAVSYKDIKLRMNYFDATKKLLSTQDFSQDFVMAPQASHAWTQKFSSVPAGTKTVKIKLIAATPAN